MKKITFYLIPALLISTSLYFSSCDSEPLISPEQKIITDVNIEDAVDDAFADDLFEDVDATVETELVSLEAVSFDIEAYQNTALKSADEGLYICKTVTVDRPDDTTRIITVDYGEGCSVVFKDDTITKKGKIIFTVTHRPFIPGATRVVTFDNFYVNDIKVEGTRTITYQGPNEDNMLVFNIKLENGKLSFPDTTTYTRDSERTRTWLRAANRLDDVLYLTGIVEGVNRRDTAYRHEITERLMIIRCEEYRYKWTIVDGIMECTVGDNTWTIDYGFGDCDSSATLFRDGQSKEIHIRSRYRHRGRRAY